MPTSYKIFYALVVTLGIELDTHQFIASRPASVPGAVVSHNQVIPVILRPALLGNESQTQGCRVSLQIHRGRAFKRRFARIADINILVEIRVMDILSVTNRPAIVTAFLDDVYLIRRDIIAEVVPAHFRGPHPPIHIAPSKENGVPEPPRILPKITAVFVHRKNLCPLVIRLI